MTHLKVGDKIPDFAGVTQNGVLVKSADFGGKKIAIYFYPKDNTPGCTVQACNLRDHFHALEDAQISVIGVSMDTETSHQKFIEKYELPFPLIADIDRKVIDAFGVWGPKKFMGKEYDGIHRTTFVIDESGTIQSIITKPKTKEHAAEILAVFLK
jgi:peroxiredoxin Q/BCP